MMAISLHQPYATAIALGLKEYETRGWSTKRRGELAICSAKAWGPKQRDAAERLAVYFPPRIELPLGVVVCVVDLADVVQMDEALIASIGHVEREFGDWRPGRFAWRQENVRRLATPVPVRGYQRLWTLDEATTAAVREALA